MTATISGWSPDPQQAGLDGRFSRVTCYADTRQAVGREVIMGIFQNKDKLPDMSKKLMGCRQIINGIDLGVEYRKLYAEYSRLYEIVSKHPTASNNVINPTKQ